MEFKRIFLLFFAIVTLSTKTLHSQVYHVQEHFYENIHLYSPPSYQGQSRGDYPAQVQNHRFEIFPGGNPNDIFMDYRFASSVKVDTSGRLQVLQKGKSMLLDKPIAYQFNALGEKRYVPVSYRIVGNRAYVQLGQYEMAEVLVIEMTHAGIVGQASASRY